MSIYTENEAGEKALYETPMKAPLLAEKPRRNRKRRMPELWAVVDMPDGSQQAYTFVTKAVAVAGEAGVREVKLCRISPKLRGFKVESVMQVG